MPPIQYPADLPITTRREEIVATIREHQVVILAGETGSGKTTQLPKMCLEAAGENLRGQIGCTQPRRVAAMSVSKRVAEELGVQWGREVGCKMRFNDDTSRDTRVKFMTDGILLAEIQSDPLLRAYSMIILDEAHERSLNIDFLLGYLRTLLPKRPDLKLLVTSATIDTQAFSAHFDNAPIIEVSGRLYPVEVRYAPLASDDDADIIDAAAVAVEDALIETHEGDVLVFMPTERDIRETCDLLEGRLGSSYEVLGLFGRMPAGEQQRVFAPGRKRRVVVATNVAETSITIPRIRYVVDTGLARMSRYNSRTRTKRLPVEAVSQSSANQRAGRAGRVQDGVCIRLYSEEDFNARDKFTTPEIQRANLAEVILRMMAFKLGDIESFPFLNPPQHAAIRSGYQLLHELGALNETEEMTPLGRELARLPLDPTLGRMLIQARKEKALPEMLIIAAGLSVPDPRERPEDKREQAAAAHKAFWCPDSDFLTLLRIWQASPESTGKGSANALRKFCKANFLSFIRMREWRDVWKQLSDTIREEEPSRTGVSPVASATGILPVPEGGQNARHTSDRQDARPTSSNDDAIHRSILSGQLGHIAMRHERNLYKAGGNREVTLFPGSNLYERRDKKNPGKPGQDKSKQPAWIVAGEIVHTSQLFARTVAKVDPNWIAELGAHLMQFKYSEPRYDEKGQRVLVMQRHILHGLEVKRQLIDFGKVDALAATQMFIRGALIDHDSELTHRFYQQNKKLREKVETSLTRVRSTRAWDVAEALYRFYEARITHVSSVHDLNKLVNERIKEEPNFLCATDKDLMGGSEFQVDLLAFPDQVAFGNSVLPLSYAYEPGEESDGVTVKVSAAVAEHLTSGQIQWMVPGIREELIEVLLRALPKAYRSQFAPIAQRAKEIATEFNPGRADFLPALAQHLTRRYRIEVKHSDWPPMSVPKHLQPRVEVMDAKKGTLVTSRDLDEVRKAVKQAAPKSDAWEKTVQRVERYALSSWSFGDLPESIFVEDGGGVPVLGHPGLLVRESEVDLRLFKTKAEVEKHTPAAIRKLAETALSKDLAWLWKELKHLGSGTSAKAAPLSGLAALSSLGAAPVKAAPDQLQRDAHEHIVRFALRLNPLLPLTEKRFTEMCEKVRRELPALAHRVGDLLKQINEWKQKLLASPKRYPGFDQDLARLVPTNLIAVTPHEQLAHVPRYLRAMQMRAERASYAPDKDASKADLIRDFDGWPQFVPQSQHETFRWMLEEYRVQVFAPELGTAQSVSVKKLEAMMV